MRIIYADMKYAYGDPGRGMNEIGAEVVRCLEALGHEVSPLWYDEAMRTKTTASEDLLLLAETFQPDLVLIAFFLHEFRPEDLTALRRTTRVAGWFADDSFRFDSYSRGWAKCLDVFLTSDIFSLRRYQDLNLPAVLFQWAAISDGLLTDDAEPRYDVSFVGGINHYRKWTVQMLRDQGIEVECFGFGWPNGPVEFTKFKQIVRESRINLNLSNSASYDARYTATLGRRARLQVIRRQIFPNAPIGLDAKIGEQIKARHFEIPLYGGFQLSNYAPFLERYFQIGDEIGVFSTVDDLAKTINYYLARSSERNKIQVAGTKRARLEHTYISRVEKMLAEVEKLVPSSPM